jgi:hypothetical protein
VMHTGVVCGKVEGWHVVCVIVRQSVCTAWVSSVRVCLCVCVYMAVAFAYTKE